MGIIKRFFNKDEPQVEVNDGPSLEEELLGTDIYDSDDVAFVVSVSKQKRKPEHLIDRNEAIFEDMLYFEEFYWVRNPEELVKLSPMDPEENPEYFFKLESHKVATDIDDIVKNFETFDEANAFAQLLNGWDTVHQASVAQVFRKPTVGISTLLGS